MFASHTSDKGLTSRIFKAFYNSTIRDNSIKNWANDFNGHLLKEDMQVSNNKYMKRFSTSLVINAMKTTMKYHFTSTSTAKKKNQ